MKQEDIKQLFEQFESASSEVDGVEVWSARESYPLFGYSQWHNFEMVREKAKKSLS